MSIHKEVENLRAELIGFGHHIICLNSFQDKIYLIFKNSINNKVYFNIFLFTNAGREVISTSEV